MPKNKEAYIRYRIIDERLRNKQKPFPSLNELTFSCSDLLGTKFSSSTIQKDILAMRNDEMLGFLAPIKFNKLDNGYHYTDPEYSISNLPLKQEELTAIEFAAGILSQFKAVKLFGPIESALEKITQAVNISRSLKSENLDHIIQVEKASFFKGSELVGPILEAIINKQVITFEHYNFTTGQTKKHLLHPYVLREHNNRWYVVGWQEELKKIRTFGLDRIEKFGLTKEKFHKDAEFDAEKFFKYSFGITVDNMIPEEIVLSFVPQDGRFIKSKAMHETQKVLIDNDEELRISLNVIPSSELTMQILSYGAGVKVIKPKWLVKKVSEILAEAQNNYH